MFYLAICPRVSYSQLGHMDVVVIVECQELVAGELCPIVSDDGVRTPNLWMISVKNSTACSDLIRLIE